MCLAQRLSQYETLNLIGVRLLLKEKCAYFCCFSISKEVIKTVVIEQSSLILEIKNIDLICRSLTHMEYTELDEGV